MKIYKIIFHSLKNKNLIMILACSVQLVKKPFLLVDHLKSQKHKLASRASLQSGKVSNFFSKLIPVKNYFALAAREATFAYHTVIQNQSFLSMT